MSAIGAAAGRKDASDRSVAQIGNLPYRRTVFCGPSVTPSSRKVLKHSADSQSATQQITNLRYEY